MKKKFSVIFILLAFAFSITFLSSNSLRTKAFAEEIEKQIETKSASCYLIEPNTNTVIYAKNENQKLQIASMCKIMTLLLCFESLDNNEFTLGDTICVSENAAGMGGSQVFLQANAEYSIGELIKSIVVASANDACVAMAEKICGSEESFVNKMNEKANSLGMTNTVFANCTGLPKPNQHSTAKDVATMFCELIKHHDYFKFSRIWTDKVAHPDDRFTEISNTNKLIRFYQGCDGGKTGYTSEAGHCLTASAHRNGMRLVGVVIKAPDSKSRFKDVSDMFNYGFSNYVNKMVIDDKKPLDLPVNVLGGKKNNLEVVAEKPIFLFSKKGVERSVEIDFQPSSSVKAPVKKGDLVGEIIVYEKGIEISRVNVVANEDILSKTFFDILCDIGEKWAIV